MRRGAKARKPNSSSTGKRGANLQTILTCQMWNASLRIGHKMHPHEMGLKYHHQWCQGWLARQRRPARPGQARPASSIIYREARMDFYQASPPENSEKFVFGCTASLRIGNKMRPHKMRLKYHHQWCQDWLARQRRPARPRQASSIIYRDVRMIFYQISLTEFIKLGWNASLRIGHKMHPHEMGIKYHHQWCQGWFARVGQSVALCSSGTTYSYVTTSCLNECLCVACWAACSQDIMLRVLFSQQISPSIQYNLNYIPLLHYSVLYPLLCWAFSPYYILQVHIFFVVYILLSFTIDKNICLYCIVSECNEPQFSVKFCFEYVHDCIYSSKNVLSYKSEGKMMTIWPKFKI